MCLKILEDSRLYVLLLRCDDDLAAVARREARHDTRRSHGARRVGSLRRAMIAFARGQQPSSHAPWPSVARHPSTPSRRIARWRRTVSSTPGRSATSPAQRSTTSSSLSRERCSSRRGYPTCRVRLDWALRQHRVVAGDTASDRR